MIWTKSYWKVVCTKGTTLLLEIMNQNWSRSYPTSSECFLYNRLLWSFSLTIWIGPDVVLTIVESAQKSASWADSMTSTCHCYFKSDTMSVLQDHYNICCTKAKFEVPGWSKKNWNKNVLFSTYFLSTSLFCPLTFKLSGSSVLPA